MNRDVEKRGAQHYARSKLAKTILDALLASGKNPDRVTPSDLSAVDEFHTGGRQATIDLTAQIDFAPGMHLLDVGCGIGGASGFFAAERDCRVTGIDLTPDYVDTANTPALRRDRAGRDHLPGPMIAAGTLLA